MCMDAALGSKGGVLAGTPWWPVDADLRPVDVHAPAVPACEMLSVRSCGRPCVARAYAGYVCRSFLFFETLRVHAGEDWMICKPCTFLPIPRFIA